MSNKKIYKLAMFDDEIGEWVFINKPFIIENTDLLSGLFLRDTWFCYKINKNKHYNDHHFMILEFDNPYDFEKTLNLINRNHLNNNRWYNKPSIKDKPPDYYSNFARYFNFQLKFSSCTSALICGLCSVSHFFLSVSFTTRRRK